MTDDAYTDFADRYDLFFDSFGEHTDEVVAFFGGLLKENCVESLLDCACGTGHDLVMFHRLGLEVFGSDASRAMLTKAEQNLSGLGLSIPLRQVDYRMLNQSYRRSFEAVVCLSSAILEMPDEDEVIRALASMRSVLADRGVLIISQGTTDKQWAEKPRFVLVVNKADFSRVFVIDYVDEGAKYNVLDVFHGEHGWDLKVWTGHYRIMLLRDDYERLLRHAGFGRVEFYGSYSAKPYSKSLSNLLIAVAHK
jgi:glycine/sarcosine N-methyltransferase